MTFRHVVCAGVLFGAPATATSMTVSEFLAKTDALKAKGMRAVFSPDLKVVIAEVRAVATAYRAELDMGRADLGCPPPKGKVKLSPTQFLKEFRAVPVPDPGTTSVRTVYYTMMRKRFPCR